MYAIRSYYARAQSAATRLHKAGFAKVFCLKGGLVDWRADNLFHHQLARLVAPPAVDVEAVQKPYRCRPRQIFRHVVEGNCAEQLAPAKRAPGHAQVRFSHDTPFHDFEPSVKQRFV